MNSEQTPIRVIHAEDDFLVLDKPAGIAVHGGSGVRGDTIVDWLIRKYPEVKRVGDEPGVRPGIVHRLDKDTSGVMVVARTQDAFENLKQLFKERKIEKTYVTLVAGAPKKKSGIIDAAIGRLRANPTKRSVLRQAQDKSALRGSRHAITEYRTLERLALPTSARQKLGGQGAWTLLEVKPKTGRMHQIRVHLASIGHPVAGDRVYGGSRTAPPGLARQFLHAWRLSFSYPEGRRWQFEAALPEDLAAVLKRLRDLRKGEKRAT